MDGLVRSGKPRPADGLASHEGRALWRPPWFDDPELIKGLLKWIQKNARWPVS
mgnify:CR=1 FL=1